MPEQPHKAVFLSYAREDSDAARRIADALRAFGIEVWFDMSELRGGDQWDQKIRRQIKDCALFMPVISKQSEERGEGYFRLEWKLAVERTHLLADNMPFLFPVVVDDTNESSASVPEQFLKAQWTRLPDGEPTPQFIEHVKRLMQGPRKSTGSTRVPMAAPSAAAAPASKSKGFPIWPVITGAVVVAAVAVIFLMRPGKEAPAPAVAAPATAAAPVVKAAEPAAPMANDKSLAVLPFTNMSEEKDSAFFTDGIQEDILTNLALISELRVVSRTSMMQYRNTTKSIKQIAQELGVTYLLEGSVRRSGNKIRVTGQLIKASTDEHVWAKAYDRELNDIFAIQESLATEIAGALQAAITPQQKTQIAGRAAANVDAYSSYLKAREIMLREDIKRVNLPEIDQLLKAAVRADPNFVLAWVEIARVGFYCYQSGMDTSRLPAAKAAVATAVRLAPGDAKVINMQGRDAQTAGDLVAARTYYERAVRQSPGDAALLLSLLNLAIANRQWADAQRLMDRAVSLDPRNPAVIWSQLNSILAVREYDQAGPVIALLEELQPGSFNVAEAKARVPFMARGSTREMEELYASLPPEQFNSPAVVTSRLNWYYHAVGDAKAYVELRDRAGTDQNFSDEDATLQYAEALLVLGQRERAEAIVRPIRDQLLAQISPSSEDYNVLLTLAYAHALLGERELTLKTIARIEALLKLDDTFGKVFVIRTNVSIVYGWIGEKDKALDGTAPYLKLPARFGIGVHPLRRDIDYFPLRGYPRWEALLNDPEYLKPIKL